MTTKFRDTEYIIIVESPSKCAKIESFVNVKGGPSYKCVSTRGHIREIADGLNDIEFTKNIRVKFTLIKEKRAHIKQLAAILQNYTPDRIFLATDDDREGEAIAWHVCQVFKLPIKDTNRIIFHEITKDAVIHGLNHPTRICMKTVAAQHARQVMDILVGYTVTPHLWSNIKTKEKRILSAGRCQTPALRLVYDHHTSPKKEPIVNTDINAHFLSTTNPVIFTCSNYTAPPSIRELFETSRNAPHILTADPPRESIRKPPQPLTTSRILQHAANILRTSPKQTMELCQELYQQGFITYLRTDSSKYSAEFIQHANIYMTKRWGAEYIHHDQSNVTQNKVSAVTPHEAIRVTNLETASIPRVDKIPKLHLMYELIWRRTVESLMADAKYEVIQMYMTRPSIQYRAELETPIFLGWQKVSPPAQMIDATKQILVKNALLANKENSAVTYVPSFMETVPRVSGCPTPHYSEASLVQKLEEFGIGRPSTYAGIAQLILERGYVAIQDVSGTSFPYKHYMTNMRNITETTREMTVGEEKQRLVIQPIGIRVVEFVIKAFARFFEYPYTKSMESALDEVDETTWAKLCLDTREELLAVELISTEITESTEVTKTPDEKRAPPMPENVLRYVNTNTSIRTGKYGPYVYYKTEKMVKPAFYSLAKFNVKLSAKRSATLNSTLSAKDYLTCEPDILLDWLKDNYGRSFS